MGTDELCPRPRSRSHHPDGFVQFFSGCYCWLGIGQSDGSDPRNRQLRVTAKSSQSLDFEIYNVVLLILAIIVVGNFLRDGKSNYLEGALCILVYLIIGKLVTVTNIRRSLTGFESCCRLVLPKSA